MIYVKEYKNYLQIANNIIIIIIIKICIHIFTYLLLKITFLQFLINSISIVYKFILN